MKLIYVPSDNIVLVNDRAIIGDYTRPSDYQGQLHAVQWFDDFGEYETILDGHIMNIVLTTDDFNAYIKPLYDKWEELRIIEDTPTPEPSLEEVRVQKLEELNNNFEYLEKHGYIMSSLGFEIDANTNANRDVSGLILMVEDGEISLPVAFMTYRNTLQNVSLENLKTMQKEIIGKGLSNYQAKWQARNEIENITDIEALKVYDVRQYFTGVEWGKSY